MQFRALAKFYNSSFPLTFYFPLFTINGMALEFTGAGGYLNMKKIFTLAIFSLVALFSFAEDHHKDGKLSVTNYSRQDIRVQVDGHFFNDRNNVVIIPSLSPGYHTVKVFRESGNRRGYFGRHRGNTVIYSKRIYVKPRFEVEVIIDRYGRTQVKESRLRDPWDRNQDRRGRNGDRRRDNDRDHRGGRGNDHYNAPMNPREFSLSMESLRREMFESARFGMALQLINRNVFTVDQVKQIVHTFSFENNRLELAKRAYGNTIDRKYYARMYEELDYANSRRDLAQYMNNYR